MYFSRLRLAPDARRTAAFWRAFTHDPYALHQALWMVFSHSPDQKRDFIYRLDTLGKGETCVFAISGHKPHADEESNRMWKVDSKPFELAFRPGDRLSFDLRANATIDVGGKRHDVVMHHKRTVEDPGTEAQATQVAGEAWLRSRSERLGFSLLAVRAEGYRVHELRKRPRKPPIRFATIDFCGLLEVTDPEIFEELLRHGVGRSRGFGCGLMLVRRA